MRGPKATGHTVLSYRHAFHAGNCADVLKHSALHCLLRAALQKPSALWYLDTHAGAGRYDLGASLSRREHEGGITALRAGADQLPPDSPLHAFLGQINALSPDHRHYPGSPQLAAAMLRPLDRAQFCELHPQDHTRLAAQFANDPRIRVSRSDGYQALKATLPPPQRRGLILIDPAYELDQEARSLIQGLRTALARFRHGTYMVWYPLQGKLDHVRLLRDFCRLEPPKTLRLNLHSVSGTSSGILVLNPPYQAQGDLARIADELPAALGSGHSTEFDWLIPEQSL